MKSPTFSRRAALTTLIGVVGTSALPRSAESANAMESIARLEHEIDGRVGLAALDTANGRWLSHRADERFAMCSTDDWAE